MTLGKKALLAFAGLLGATTDEVADLLRDVPIERLRCELSGPCVMRIILACAPGEMLRNEMSRRTQTDIW